MIALHRHDFLSDVHHVLGQTEPNDIARPRVSFWLTMGHAHAATRDHVIADDRRAVPDRDEAQVLCEDIDIVVRRQCDANLEFARHIGPAIDRFIFLDTARDTLLAFFSSGSASYAWPKSASA